MLRYPGYTATRADQRLDGKWLAYVEGLPIMREDFSNVTYVSERVALTAIEAEQQRRRETVNAASR